MRTPFHVSTCFLGVVLGRIFAQVSAEEDDDTAPAQDSSSPMRNSILVIGLVVISAFSVGLCVLGGCYFAIVDFRASHVMRINREKGMLEDEENVKDGKEAYSHSGSQRPTCNTADFTHSSDSDEEESQCDDSLALSRSYTNDNCDADRKDEKARKAGGTGAEELKEESGKNVENLAPDVPQVALDIKEGAQQSEAEERQEKDCYGSPDKTTKEKLQTLKCTGGNSETKDGVGFGAQAGSPSQSDSEDGLETQQVVEDDTSVPQQQSVNRSLFSKVEPPGTSRRKSRGMSAAPASEEDNTISPADADVNTTPRRKALSLDCDSASPLDERAIASTLLCNVCSSSSSSTCKCGQHQSSDGDNGDACSVGSNNTTSVGSTRSGSSSSSSNGGSRSKTRRRSRPAPTSDKSSSNGSAGKYGPCGGAVPSEEEEAPSSSSSPSSPYSSSAPTSLAVRPSSTSRSRARAAPRASHRLQEVDAEITDAQP